MQYAQDPCNAISIKKYYSGGMRLKGTVMVKKFHGQCSTRFELRISANTPMQKGDHIPVIISSPPGQPGFSNRFEVDNAKGNNFIIFLPRAVHRSRLANFAVEKLRIQHQ